MKTTDDNLVACETCGTLIEGTHTHQLGPMQIVCTQTHCKECEYREEFRCSRLVRKQPYRDPFPRPTMDGKMPKELREKLAKQHQEKS